MRKSNAKPYEKPSLSVTYLEGEVLLDTSYNEQTRDFGNSAQSGWGGWFQNNSSSSSTNP